MVVLMVVSAREGPAINNHRVIKKLTFSILSAFELIKEVRELFRMEFVDPDLWKAIRRCFYPTAAADLTDRVGAVKRRTESSISPDTGEPLCSQLSDLARKDYPGPYRRPGRPTVAGYCEQCRQLPESANHNFVLNSRISP